MNPDHILVTYASQMGSTAEIAAAMGNILTGHGARVDIRRMKDVDDVSPYCAVIAGSAIQGSKWMLEGMNFIRKYQTELRQKPCATFLACITLGMVKTDQYRESLKMWMQPVREMVRPRLEGYFAGALDIQKLPVTPNGLLLRLTIALHILPSGDHRDWQAIQLWTEEAYSRLLA
jgi:menaquinone-dependent protoporphyrinogen oxidase